MDRRALLKAGMGGLSAVALAARGDAATLDTGGPKPIRATPDRLFRVTICLRPFRAAGPRIEVEEVRRTRVVHNYGHGGSGWSLSWGSTDMAVGLADRAGEISEQ